MKIVIKTALSLLAIILFSGHTLLYASLPSTINFQGQIIKSNGRPATGTLPVTINIYGSLTGGIALKTLSGVSVSFNASGVFVVALDISGLDLNQNLWLGIAIGQDAEMIPRAPILPSAASIFALNSASAQNSQNSDKLGGSAAGSYFMKSGGTLNGQLNMNNYSVLSSSSIEGVKKIIWADGSISTSAAAMSGGDMTRATYDTNLNGLVDDSDKLGGNIPSYYANRTDVAVSTNTLQSNIDKQFMVSPSTGIMAGTLSNTVKITTGNVSAIGTASSTTFLRGDGSWNTPAGSGDMTKSVYDIGNNGIVDDSEKLGTQLPSYFAVRADVAASTATFLTQSSATVTYLNISGKAVGSSDSDRLGGNMPSYYANRLDVAVSTNTLQLNIDKQFIVSPSTGIMAGTLTNTVKITTGNVSAIGTASNTTFLRGDGSWNTPVGSGDMTKSVYDIGNDGIVDDSEKLGAQLPSYYAIRTDVSVSTATFLTQSSATVTYLNISGKATGSSDSDQLGGNIPSYYANRTDVAVSTNTLQLNIDKQFMVSPSTGIMAGTLSNTVKITTGNVAAAGSASNTTFLRGDGSWGTPTGDISYGEMFSNGAAVNTTIGAIETFVKIANDTTAGDLNNFTHTTGRLTYSGTTTKEFRVNVSLNAQNTTAAQTIRFSVAKNGVFLGKSRATVSLTYTTDGYCVSTNCLTSLATGDYIEVFTANATAATVVTVSDLNVNVASVE